MRTDARPRAAAGQYNKPVIVRTATLEPDGAGGWTEGPPVDVGPIPASINGLSGTELTQAMQTGMRRPYEIEMRYRDDLTGATTIVYGGRTFDVKSIVDPEERHVILIVLADEVAG